MKAVQKCFCTAFIHGTFKGTGGGAFFCDIITEGEQ